jgi:uncharacterized damage-inducible protein DinB
MTAKVSLILRTVKMELKRHNLFPVANFPQGIGYHLAAMEEVREQLRAAVQGMTNEEISRRAVPGAHSIGALVLHIGEAEWWWMNCIVKGHELTDDDRRAPYWDVLEDPDQFAAHNYSITFCLETIAAIREGTRSFLASLSDSDLENVYSHTRGERRTEASLRWILHHLVDHEAQHKGQILMLKRLLGTETVDMI